MTTNRINPEDLLALVGQIYDAALEPSLWGEFIDGLRPKVGADGIALVLFDPANPSMCLEKVHLFDRKDMERYHSRYMSIDIWNHALAQRPTGNVYASHTEFTEKQIRDSQFYQEFWGDLGLHHTCGGFFVHNGARLGLLGAQRGIGEPGFEEANRAIIQALIPHLNRAFSIHERLADLSERGEAATESLDRMCKGILLLDASGRVLFTNGFADHLVRNTGGLTIINGKLCADHHGESQLLQRVIGDVASTASLQKLGAGKGLAIRRVRAPSARPLAVVVSPFRPPSVGFIGTFRAARVLVSVTDPDTLHVPQTDVVRDLYGLTPAESVVCLNLAQGLTVNEIADTLHLSRETVRTHTKRILFKTGTKRQSELLRLLLQ